MLLIVVEIHLYEVLLRVVKYDAKKVTYKWCTNVAFENYALCLIYKKKLALLSQVEPNVSLAGFWYLLIKGDYESNGIVVLRINLGCAFLSKFYIFHMNVYMKRKKKFQKKIQQKRTNYWEKTQPEIQFEQILISFPLRCMNVFSEHFRLTLNWPFLRTTLCSTYRQLPVPIINLVKFIHLIKVNKNSWFAVRCWTRIVFSKIRLLILAPTSKQLRTGRIFSSQNETIIRIWV